jgi:hypothetical protein
MLILPFGFFPFLLNSGSEAIETNDVRTSGALHVIEWVLVV